MGIRANAEDMRGFGGLPKPQSAMCLFYDTSRATGRRWPERQQGSYRLTDANVLRNGGNVAMDAQIRQH